MNYKKFKSMLQLLIKPNDEGHCLRMALYNRIKDTLTYTDMWELSHSSCQGHYYDHPLYAGLKSIYEECYDDNKSEKKN